MRWSYKKFSIWNHDDYMILSWCFVIKNVLWWWFVRPSHNKQFRKTGKGVMWSLYILYVKGGWWYDMFNVWTTDQTDYRPIFTKSFLVFAWHCANVCVNRRFRLHFFCGFLFSSSVLSLLSFLRRDHHYHHRFSLDF